MDVMSASPRWRETFEGTVGKVRSRRSGRDGQLWEGLGACKGVTCRNMKGGEKHCSRSRVLWTFSGQNSGVHQLG